MGSAEVFNFELAEQDGSSEKHTTNPQLNRNTRGVVHDSLLYNRQAHLQFYYENRTQKHFESRFPGVFVFLDDHTLLYIIYYIDR